MPQFTASRRLVATADRPAAACHTPWVKPRAALSEVAHNALVNGLIASGAVPRHFRWRLLRLCGLEVDHSSVSSQVFFGGTNTQIGRGTFVNHRAFIDDSAPVVIGQQVQFGPEVMILTSSHQIGAATQRAGDAVTAPVTIGDGCWLGARVTILPGVSIGSGCIVAAGAVVTEDCVADGLYAGVPARRIRDL